MKKIKNQKGFTLIELLAVIIILAIIMTVAIPNILGTLEKNKKDSVIKDAKRAISSCEYTIRSEKKYEYPDETTAIIFPFSEIKNLDLDMSSYDTYYSQKYSFVAITKDKVKDSQGQDTIPPSYEYQYYVHLVSCVTEECEMCLDDECDDHNSEKYKLLSKNRGINLEPSQGLEGSSKYDLVVKGDELVVDYIEDSTGQYENLKSQLNEIRTRNGQVGITEVVVY